MNMELDNDKFYVGDDGVPSLPSFVNDYHFEDLEILGSSDSRLDSSLNFADLNPFNDYNSSSITDRIPSPVFDGSILSKLWSESTDCQSIDMIMQQTLGSPIQKQEFNGDVMDYNTSSISSIDADATDAGVVNNFNPDDFLNFLNDCDVPMHDLTHDSPTAATVIGHQRNAPSPTGSCTSSSGSSTSGIQSDASSEISMSQNNNDGDSKIAISKQQIELLPNNPLRTPSVAVANNVNQNVNPSSAPMPRVTTVYNIPMNIAPLSAPIQPIAMKSNNHINVATNHLIPVQTVPITTVIPAITVNTPIAANTDTFKANKTIEIVAPLTNSTPITLTTPAIPVTPTPISAQKIKTTANTTIQLNNCSSSAPTIPTIPPAPATKVNNKPKTVFISLNDYKNLMRKMNGTVNGGTNMNKKSLAAAIQIGQGSKVVVKAPNGKLITANRIATATIPNIHGNSCKSDIIQQQSIQFPAAKFAKNNSPTAMLQQNRSAITATVRGSLANQKLNNTAAAVGDDAAATASIPKTLIDEKLLKKQQRMLKNRESASLSRKKKKEYVESLENHISILEKENCTLKGENSSLRSQLMAFAQTCQCKHSNVSEFILNTLNIDTKYSGPVLKALDNALLMNQETVEQTEKHSGGIGGGGSGATGCASLNGKKSSTSNSISSTRHVKIAPKPLHVPGRYHKGLQQRMSAATVKKNIAVLFAMAFMITLNVGNFQNYLNRNMLDNILEENVALNIAANDDETIASSRRLLWVPTEEEFYEQSNRSKRDTDFVNNLPSPPPLHFLRPHNRTEPEQLMNTEPALTTATTTTTSSSPLHSKKSTICTSGVLGNSTNYIQENMRLARNLHKWIDGNDYLNLSTKGNGNDLDYMGYFQLNKDYMNLDLAMERRQQHKRKILIGNHQSSPEKLLRLNGDVEDNKSLDVFKPRINEEYLRLFKGIKRQQDTFYVLSFNMDHILLPASAYNKTARPKMSLMLPAGDPSLNGDIVLMQIDCEVINTTELELKSHMIPEKLRPARFKSYDMDQNDTMDDNDNDNMKNHRNQTTARTVHEEQQVHSNSQTYKHHADTFGNWKEAQLMQQEKPAIPPRTYFMMGPKNYHSQVAITDKTTNNSSTGGNTTTSTKTTTTTTGSITGNETFKKKPNIGKLNTSDIILGSGIFNVRSASLFAKMQQTVGNNVAGMPSSRPNTASTIPSIHINKILTK